MLAHGVASASGPSVPLLIAGGVLLLAAVVGLVRRLVKPQVGIGLLVAGLALGGGAFAFGGS